MFRIEKYPFPQRTLIPWFASWSQTIWNGMLRGLWLQCYFSRSPTCKLLKDEWNSCLTASCFNRTSVRYPHRYSSSISLLYSQVQLWFSYAFLLADLNHAWLHCVRGSWTQQGLTSMPLQRAIWFNNRLEAFPVMQGTCGRIKLSYPFTCKRKSLRTSAVFKFCV